MTFLDLKMIIFGHFSRFLAPFKISFLSLQHPTYVSCYICTILHITFHPHRQRGSFTHALPVGIKVDFVCLLGDLWYGTVCTSIFVIWLNVEMYNVSSNGKPPYSCLWCNFSRVIPLTFNTIKKHDRIMLTN